MKNIVIICMLVIMNGCKQDEEVKKVLLPLGPVFAGQVNNELVYHDFIPDIDLDTLSGVPMIEPNSNELNLDINKDGGNDINFLVRRSEPGVIYSIDLNPLNKSSISVYSFGCMRRISGCNCKECWGRVPIFKSGSRIDNDTSTWTPVGVRDKEGDTLFNTYSSLQRIYSYDTTSWQNKPNQYLGFRFVEDNDTLYGWMRLSIVGKAHIVVHDLAYQKR